MKIHRYPYLCKTILKSRDYTYLMTKYFLGLFCLVLSVISCQNQSVFDYDAMKRELNENPRELLVKLDTLLSTRLNKQDKADATLMRYDCFERLDSFPKPDSTLLELTQYYNSIGDSAKLCRAYYFNARQLHSDYFYIRAMVNYRKAERLAANVDSTLLFQIKMHLVPIYHFNQQATTEMETLNEAISLAIQLNDSLLLSKAYKTEAMLHREHKRYEEALVSFNKACGYAPFDKRKWKAEMLMEKARTQLSLDKLEQALTTLDKAIATDSADVPQAYRAKVCIKYFMSPNPDSHGKFLNIVQQMPLMEKMNAYRNAAHWLQLHGMSEEALACMKKYTDLRDSLDMNRKDIFLERARMLQDFKRQQERVAEAENERTSDWMLFYRLLALFALSLLLLFAFYHNMKRKKSRLEIGIQQEKKENYRLMLKQQQTEMQLLREKEAKEKMEIDQLSQKVEYFKRLNAITVPILMNTRNRTGALHLTEEDWETVVNNTNACFDNFTSRLKAQHPTLTDEEIRFCCLIKMELPLSLLAEIYHIAKGSISRKKMRLKEKMTILNGTFDEYIADF